MKVLSSSLLGYLFVITIFTKLTGIEIPGLGTIDIYAYPILFFIFLVYPVQLKNLIFVTGIFIIIFLISLIIKIELSYSLGPLFKQIIPAFIIYLATVKFLARNDIKLLFKKYSNISYLLAVFGIIQVMLSFLGVYISSHPRFSVDIFSVNFMRLSSLLPEPSHYAVVVIPAFIYCYFSYGLKSIKTILILFSILLTLSATGLVTIFLAFLIHNFKRLNIYSILGIILLIILSYIGYLNIQPIKYRIDETIKYMDIRDFTNTTNATTFSLISNFNVAFYSLEQSIFFGVGLGGHEEAYYKYFDKIDYSNFKDLYERKAGFNAKSAHALSIRILSELGTVGFFFVIFFILNYRVKNTKNEYYIISLACLSYFIARIFKLGGYFDYGIYFFVITYYFSYVRIKKEQ